MWYTNSTKQLLYLFEIQFGSFFRESGESLLSITPAQLEAVTFDQVIAILLFSSCLHLIIPDMC